MAANDPTLADLATNLGLPAEVEVDRIPERLGRESCPSSLMRPR